MDAEAERIFIEQNFRTMLNVELGEKLNRTRVSIEHYLVRHDMRRTAEERKLLHAKYKKKKKEAEETTTEQDGTPTSGGS